MATYFAGPPALLAAGIAVGLLATPDLARAQTPSWRVENRVYRGNESEPFARSLTLIDGPQAFDQLDGQRSATIYDFAGRLCTLLNSAAGVQTELRAEELARFEQELRTWCGRQSEPVLKFLAEPRFQERFDADQGTLVLEHRWLTYRATTQPAPAEIPAARYVEFSSFVARVNAMLNPGGLPPFGRLALDRSLSAHGVLPKTIELTYSAGTGKQARTVQLRSEHEFSTRLLDDDARRLAGLRRELATLRRVSFPDFQALSNSPATGR